MKHKSLKEFLSSEAVLCVAVILGISSCFFVRPDSGYLSYIDFRTIALLFSLMTAMAGFREQGLFFHFGELLLQKTKSLRQVILVLVLLCFFCSMVITNDVALITFVPFTFAVFNILGEEQGKSWILPVVCMQTVAANLGSMLLPIGNPQNIYLYEKSGLSLLSFMLLMLPYTIASLILLLSWIYLACRRNKNISIELFSLSGPSAFHADKRRLLLHSVLFLLCFLTVAHILPYQVLFCAILISALLFDRRVLLSIDYSLLVTFIGFFVFIGNLGRVASFSRMLGHVIAGREVLLSVITSQVISNVPAALLLSGFTENISGLIVGTNLGGLGTIIASMASLISFRQIAGAEGISNNRYFVMFTISNIIFLFVLLLVHRLGVYIGL